MATAKKTTKTRESQYISILKEKCYDFSQCDILGYKFEKISDANAFHFDIMVKNLEYLLFDGARENVKIIVEKNSDTTNFNIIAEKNNGISYKPLKYNDYE